MSRNISNISVKNAHALIASIDFLNNFSFLSNHMRFHMKLQKK